MRQATFIDVEELRDFPALGVFSTWFGVILILLTAVGRIILGERNRFWAEPFVASLELVLMALILASFLYVPFRAQRGMKWAAIPLMINLGTLIIAHLVPFNALWESFRFRWHWHNYDDVAGLIELGELQPDQDGMVRLPDYYRPLSADNGRAWVETEGDTLSIFFLSKQNTTHDFAGYLYRSDDTPPKVGDFGGQWRYVEQKRPHWYYCISN